MSDRVSGAFSLVAALADRVFVGVGGRAQLRRRDRYFSLTPIASGTPAAGPSTASSTAGRSS